MVFFFLRRLRLCILPFRGAHAHEFVYMHVYTYSYKKMYTHVYVYPRGCTCVHAHTRVHAPAHVRLKAELESITGNLTWCKTMGRKKRLESGLPSSTLAPDTQHTARWAAGQECHLLTEGLQRTGVLPIPLLTDPRGGRGGRFPLPHQTVSHCSKTTLFRHPPPRVRSL